MDKITAYQFRDYRSGHMLADNKVFESLETAERYAMIRWDGLSREDRSLVKDYKITQVICSRDENGELNGPYVPQFDVTVWKGETI